MNQLHTELCSSFLKTTAMNHDHRACEKLASLCRPNQGICVIVAGLRREGWGLGFFFVSLFFCFCFVVVFFLLGWILQVENSNASKRYLEKNLIFLCSLFSCFIIIFSKITLTVNSSLKFLQKKLANY